MMTVIMVMPVIKAMIVIMTIINMTIILMMMILEDVKVVIFLMIW